MKTPVSPIPSPLQGKRVRVRGKLREIPPHPSPLPRKRERGRKPLRVFVYQEAYRIVGAQIITALPKIAEFLPDSIGVRVDLAFS